MRNLPCWSSRQPTSPKSHLAVKAPQIWIGPWSLNLGMPTLEINITPTAVLGMVLSVMSWVVMWFISISAVVVFPVHLTRTLAASSGYVIYKALTLLSMISIPLIYHLKLSSHIPLEVGNLGFMSDLNLSNSNFMGQIPPSLGNLTRLTHLDLSRNSLFGPIPS